MHCNSSMCPAKKKQCMTMKQKIDTRIYKYSIHIKLYRLKCLPTIVQ